jgi:hypothetical protein
MASAWRWTTLDDLRADMVSATNDTLTEMRRWAADKERRADAPGKARNPRARRLFRQMGDAADAELDRRGLLWPEQGD